MQQSGVVTAASRRISQRLAERIGHHTYDMWFANTTRLQVEGSRVRVDTDCRFVADWIRTHFGGDLDGAARETLGDQARVDLDVKPELFSSDHHVLGRNAADRPAPSGANGRAGVAADGAAAPSPGAWRPGVHSGLRRLEDYVVGPSNQLAYTAALRIADGTAGGRSMLFVHGECGVGKTHLLQGVTQQFAESAGRAAGRGVRYVTAEQFTNEYIHAVRGNSIERFRRRTRKLALLAIDDVHFLSNKVATQNELLHTIDAIDLSGSQLVLASDEHPQRLGINQALSSRFVAGMVARIDQPDRATRIKLTQRLAASRGLKLSGAAAEAIAARCVGSVRELEGAINKLAALRVLSSDANGGEIGLVLVEQVFANGNQRPRTPLQLATVIDVVCGRLVVTRPELMGSGRHRRVVTARGLVAYLGRELTTMSYPEIAAALGRKHHSTIHTAVARTGRQLADQQRVEVGESGEAVTINELLEQLRHEILKAGKRRA